MSHLRMFLKLLFRLDPELEAATEKTDRMEATLNGDTKWMMVCKPKSPDVVDTILCDDGNSYKKE